MIKPLFPILLHDFAIKNFNEIKDDLIKFAYDEKKSSPGYTKSNIGGWQSHTNYQDSKNILNEVLIEPVVRYYKENEIFHQDSLIRFNAMWININPPGSHNRTHLHPNSDLAGVFWIKLPPHSGRLEFTNPYGYQYSNVYTQFNQKLRDDLSIHPSIVCDPVEGKVVLFPSYVFHRVEENESDEDRISVSFNLLVGEP